MKSQSLSHEPRLALDEAVDRAHVQYKIANEVMAGGWRVPTAEYYEAADRAIGDEIDVREMVKALEPLADVGLPVVQQYANRQMVGLEDKPLQHGLGIVGLAFTRDDRSLSADLRIMREHDTLRNSHYATIVPSRRSGWTPQENVPYAVMLERRIDKGGQGFNEGVWTAAPIVPEQDERRASMRGEYNRIIGPDLWAIHGAVTKERSQRSRLDLERLSGKIDSVVEHLDAKDGDLLRQAADLRRKINELSHLYAEVPEVDWGQLENAIEENPPAHPLRYTQPSKTALGERQAEWMGRSGKYESEITYKQAQSKYESDDGAVRTRTDWYVKDSSDVLVEGDDVVSVREELKTTLFQRRSDAQLELEAVEETENAILDAVVDKVLEGGQFKADSIDGLRERIRRNVAERFKPDYQPFDYDTAIAEIAEMAARSFQKHPADEQ